MLRNAYINKKIKIAFFSADIRANHSITKFLKTLLVGKERNNFEIIIISNLKKDDYDKTTYEFQSLADKWIEINGMENEYGINLIRKENLDIAIDLMGYTSFNKIEYLFSFLIFPISIFGKKTIISKSFSISSKIKFKSF